MASQPRVRRMNHPRRDPRDTLAGTFLILFGLAFTLAGGACSVVWVSFLYNGWGTYVDADLFGILWLLVAIVCAGLGVLAIERGIRGLAHRPEG